jgi:dGTPase
LSPYPRFPGLNLTFEVREGIVKHSRDFAPGEIPELDEYLPGLRPPLEAQLIDLCDEIAYNTADLDDAYGAGLIVVEEACSAVALFAELHETTEYQFPGLAERVRVKEIVRGLIDVLVSGLMEGTVTACAGLADVDAVRLHPERVARFTPGAAEASAQLKRFLRKSVYESSALVRARTASVGLIGTLFEFLLEHPDRMPADYREESAGQPLHRQVCDYIAGMTDGFFIRTCEQLGVS